MMRSNHLIHIRVTAEQKQELARIAEERGLTVSEHLRQAGLYGSRSEERLARIEALLRRLHRRDTTLIKPFPPGRRYENQPERPDPETD